VEKGKPAPDGYLLALRRLNETEENKISPSECVVIEDSRWGLEAAIKAGMHTVAVTNSYKPEELKMAEKIVQRLDTVSIESLKRLCE
ncbi:unnamed protein product, partial [marine sediment metagenome]